MKNFGIVLLVSERSGSNLLRSLLGNHSQITAPVAPHLLAEFYNMSKYYGDLRDPININTLVKEMISLANHPYHNWGLSENNILHSEISELPSSVVSAMDFIYKFKAKQENKSCYCSKGIESFKFIDQIRAEVPSIKFVHLVRDPRDHVASWLNKPLHLFTALDAILKWKEEQEIFINAIQRKALNCISVKYEDLISDPAFIISKILNFLELPVEDQCFNTETEKNETLMWNPYWKNLSKPIMNENMGKYNNELSDEEINIIETVARCEMEYFDYKPISKQNWIYDNISKARLIAQKTEREKTSNIKPFIELQSKMDFIKTLKDQRIKEWYEQNKEFSWIPIKFNNEITKSNFKKRIKYLSFALIGEIKTKKLINSIWK